MATRLRLGLCIGAFVCGCFPPSPVDQRRTVDRLDAGQTSDAAQIDASSAMDDGGADAGFEENPLLRPPTFVNSWGGRGLEEGQFIEPSSVELDSDGIVIVAGHEDRIQRFTRDGELLDIFGEPGAGDGQFNHPHGLAVDRMRDNLVYVGDQENHRLQVFTKDGIFVRQWGDDKFQHIHDVGIDPASGELFVGDYELHTLRKFSATGTLLWEHGGAGTEPGLFNGVWGVSTDSNSNIYVVDTFNRRVQKLDRDGNFVLQWNEYRGDLFVKPTGVFVDNNDLVYVCDSRAEAVMVFDVNGAPLARWDLPDIFGGRSEPEDIVIDADGTHIYVAEVWGHRVLHFIRR